MKKGFNKIIITEEVDLQLGNGFEKKLWQITTALEVIRRYTCLLFGGFNEVVFSATPVINVGSSALLNVKNAWFIDI